MIGRILGAEICGFFHAELMTFSSETLSSLHMKKYTVIEELPTRSPWPKLMWQFIIVNDHHLDFVFETQALSLKASL